MVQLSFKPTSGKAFVSSSGGGPWTFSSGFGGLALARTFFFPGFGGLGLALTSSSGFRGLGLALTSLSGFWGLGLAGASGTSWSSSAVAFGCCFFFAAALPLAYWLLASGLFWPEALRFLQNLHALPFLPARYTQECPSNKIFTVLKTSKLGLQTCLRLHCKNIGITFPCTQGSHHGLNLLCQHGIHVGRTCVRQQRLQIFQSLPSLLRLVCRTLRSLGNDDISTRLP